MPQVSGPKRYWRFVMLACITALVTSFLFTGGAVNEKLLLTTAILAVFGATFAVTAVAHAHAPHQRRAFLIVAENEGASVRRGCLSKDGSRLG